MDPKKNPKVDLNKNSSLYFVIGLSIVLLITWRVIEWKTYKNVYDYEVEQNDNKREIKLINPDFIQDIDYEVKTAFTS